MEKVFTAYSTNNGYCYKNYDNFMNNHDEVCYIAECGFTQHDGDHFALKLNDTQIAEMIANGSASTYNVLMNDIQALCLIQEVPQNRNFMAAMAECAFDICDWQCLTTWLNELDMSQEYADWCDERKYEFELYAVTHIRDELSGELLDEAYHNELLERLYSYFGENCYLYNSTEDLIDKWDNGPCY